MKALHMLDALNRGGSESTALDFCRRAGEFGIDLTFVAAGSGHLEGEFRSSGVEYIEIPRRLPIDPFLILKLRKLIKQGGIRVVRGSQPVEAIHLYLASLGMKQVKTVLVHDGFIEGAKNRIAAKFIAPRMDANVAVSKNLLPWIEKEIGVDTSDFEIIWNAADPERFGARDGDLRAELTLPKGAKLLGMVANFVATPTKDQLTICRALPRVFEKFEDAYFVFAGRITGSGETSYRKCVEFCRENGILDRVFFLGQRNDIPNVLSSLDLFVFSSRQEGLPIAAAEAMLSGVPLLVADIPTLLEVTDDGEYAGTFAVGDSDDLAEKLVHALNDGEWLRKTRLEAKRFAEEHLTTTAQIRKTKKLYERLLES